MTAIDPRIAARRRQVREQGARHRLRWVLAVALLVLAGLGAWWLFQSSYLEVHTVRVVGSEQADVAAALESVGLREGMPVPLVRPGRIEAAVREDPWVRDAAVAIDFPHVVTVEVLEYTPFAVLGTPDGWMLVSRDGAVLAAVAEPPPGLPTVTGVPRLEPGAAVVDAATTGALTFLRALAAERRAASVVTLGGDALRATVAGTAALLGTAHDMEAKGAAVGALLAGDLDERWSLDVTAPSRPALVPPLLPAPVEPPAEAVPEGQGG